MLHLASRADRLLALLLLAGGIVLGATGCKTGNISPESEVPFARTTFSFDQGIYPSDLDLFPKYTISPGDVLDVLFQIQRNQVERFPITLYHTISVKFVDLPNLNEVQDVLPDGTIMLPYLGAVYVLDKTATELTDELKEKYSGVLRDPELYVTILNFNARIEQLRRDLHTAPRGLSKLVTVRPDGYAAFPLIGEYLVAKKSINQVNAEVQEAYEKFLPGMNINLFLHEQAGSVVYLTGEVAEPGAYEMRKPITVLQAMALGGGFTHEAELRNVVVFRLHEQKRIARSLNVSDLTTTQRDAAFFYLRPDDIIFIPRTRIASLAQLMQQIADIALFRGWSASYSLGESVNFINDTSND